MKNESRALAAARHTIRAMPVRMKDIAKDLGVSVVTVSKALHDRPDISEETKKRVRARAAELNFRPNLAAQGLITGHNLIVGFVVPDLVHAFFSELASGLTSVLRKAGYGLILSCSNQDPELELQQIRDMLARRVDVLLLASCLPDRSRLEAIQERATPLILVDRYPAGHKANFVGSNDELIGEIATEHLVQIGRRRIAHITGPQVSPSINRLKGYRTVLARHGIEVPEQYVVTDELADVGGHLTSSAAMELLLGQSPRPDAVFCYNDPFAIGAMSTILKTGLRVPEDIALVGCGNLPYSGYLRVPLTSVDQSSVHLGEEAAKMALDLVEKKHSGPAKSILIKPRLMVRESTVKSA